MSDALIPLGLLAFIGLFVFALVREGRKQERGKSNRFRDFARSRGLRYRPTDDGAVQQFARDLDGIGRFHSPSLGQVVPKDVVTGSVEGFDLILFRHSTRFHEGYRREWYVAGISNAAPGVDRCAVQFSEGEIASDSLHLLDGIVAKQRIGPLEVAVRAPDRASAAPLMEGTVLERLARLATELGFLPEIQLRPGRVAVYPAGRNYTIEAAEALPELVSCAAQVARVCREGST